MKEEDKWMWEDIKTILILGAGCFLIWLVTLPWEIENKVNEIRTNTTWRLNILLT